MSAHDPEGADEPQDRDIPLEELLDTDGSKRRHRCELEKQALRLLARACIENVPDRFDGSLLMYTIHRWKRELPELRAGPEPLKADKDALGEVSAAAKKLVTKLGHLDEAMAAPASRIADSRFNGPWPRERLAGLRRELLELAAAAGSRDLEDDMRRPDILPRKPKGGRSALETFLGHDLPMLYRQMFPGRRFTVSGKEDAKPSEGVRFACAVASEVLGYEATPAAVVKARTRLKPFIQKERPASQAAQGGQRRRK